MWSFAVRSALAVTGFLAGGAVGWWVLDGWMSWLALGALAAAAGLSARRRRARFVLASELLRDLRPAADLPRAEVRALPAARPPAPTVAPARVAPTPATEEPRTLR